MNKETQCCTGPCGRDLPLSAFWTIHNRRGDVVPRRQCKDCLHEATKAAARKEARNRKARETRRAQAADAGYGTAPRRWWGVLRTAVELGVSRSQVYVLIERDVLVAQKDASRQWRIDPSSVSAQERAA